MATKRPLLDLQTTFERPTVLIDGTAYELRGPGELTLIERIRMTEWRTQLNVIGKATTDEMAGELTDLLARLVTVALLAPDEVRARLNDDQRFAICLAFFALSTTTPSPTPRAKPTTTRATKTMTSQGTGATSSRGSSASTATRRKPGSPRSRSRSSGAPSA